MNEDRIHIAKKVGELIRSFVGLPKEEGYVGIPITQDQLEKAKELFDEYKRQGGIDSFQTFIEDVVKNGIKTAKDFEKQRRGWER